VVLVDSSVWIDYFNGASNWQVERLDHLLSRDFIIIGDLILTEILQGFTSDRDFKLAHDHLSLFKKVNLVNFSIAIKSAENYRNLRKKGITVRKTIDCLIATYCIENSISLLHNDKDFNPFSRHLMLKIIKC